MERHTKVHEEMCQRCRSTLRDFWYECQVRWICGTHESCQSISKPKKCLSEPEAQQEEREREREREREIEQEE